MAQKIGHHPDEMTWRVADSHVWKAFTLTIDPDAVILPTIEGVAPWKRFWVPDDALREELGIPAGDWFIGERDFLPGQTLDAAYKESARAPLDDALKLSLILRDLHELGLVHGDLQPRNIIVEQNRLYLIDIALDSSRSSSLHHASRSSRLHHASRSSRLNHASRTSVAGSAPTMAPELWEGSAPTRASDVYALGTLIFWLFEQRYPFHADTLSDWAKVHLKSKPATPEKLPAGLADLTMRTLSRNPDERPDLQTLIDRLRAEGATAPARPVVIGSEPYRKSILQILNATGHVGVRGEDVMAHLIEAARLNELRGLPTAEVRQADSVWESLEDTARRLQIEPLPEPPTSRLDRFRAYIQDFSDLNATLIWSDSNYTSELLEWLDFALEHADPTRLKLVISEELTRSKTGFHIVETKSLTATFWKNWRAQTLRVEVRDIIAKRFNELVAESGTSIGSMSAALNKELGVHAGLQALSTAQQKTLASDWRDGPDRTLGEDGPLLNARILHALGRHLEGIEAIARLPPSPGVELWRAQLSLSAGLLDQAQQHAELGLTLDPEDDLQLPLRALAISPAAMRGQAGPLGELATLILSLEARQSSPMALARLHAYRAIGLTRAGQLDVAADAHVRALEIVEKAGLEGELPTFLLNAGTAYHRQGRLGLAREFYARGIRLSHAQTRPNTRALLLANQANVDLTLGRLQEAEVLLERATKVCQEHDLRTTHVLCLTLKGDLHHARDEFDLALQTFELAAQGSLSPAQEAELALASAQTRLAMQNPGAAEDALDRARQLIEDKKISDFEPLHGMLRARLQWADGADIHTMAGIELFRRSLKAAHDSGNHKLVLQQAPYLVNELHREGMQELLDETSELVQDSRNAIAMGLTRELRRDFFANLPTMKAVAKMSAPAQNPEPEQHGTDLESFYRMLSFNEVILRAKSSELLLSRALEIAIALSGAERAYILLREADQFQVAASRDVDGKPITTPHLNLSQTIAEEAARTGRTVLTLNAREDSRFDSALSVVDLDLTSVLCVPVRNADGLLGALYLDHRFHPGVFEGEVPRMMEAFAHQVALALTNLDRMRSLKLEQERLAKANAELDALARERAILMESLKGEVSALNDEVVKARAESTRPEVRGIVYASKAMETLLGQVGRVARARIPVVIHGESGTGKELVARAIHEGSDRSKQAFVALNCGAISESLMESEMFGHVKGAFTGAATDRIGMFQAAHQGTLFLDEIAELPLNLQVKLLRVLQEGQVRRVGSSANEVVDVRVVAATHRDLLTMVGEGTFREDLYYRIAAVTLEIPPLRDRPEDVIPIARKILDGLANDVGYQPILNADAGILLSRQVWKGNVRELENILRAAVVLNPDAHISAGSVAPFLSDTILPRDPKPLPHQAEVVPTRGRPQKVTRAQAESALESHNQDRSEAAHSLGVSVRTLYRALARKFE